MIKQPLILSVCLSVVLTGHLMPLPTPLSPSLHLTPLPPYLSLFCLFVNGITLRNERASSARPTYPNPLQPSPLSTDRLRKKLS